MREAHTAAEERSRKDAEQQLREQREARERADAHAAAEEGKRGEVEQKLQAEREARERADEHAAAEKRSRREADAHFRSQGREILLEARRTAEEQERAIAQARQQCEALEAQLRAAVAALGAIEEAARAHALVNARVDVHLAGEHHGGGSDPARGSD